MLPANPTSSAPPKPLALLFTDSRGSLVFADRNFLRLTKQSTSNVTFGRALNDALAIDRDLAKRFIDGVEHSEFLHHFPMAVLTTTGSLWPVAGAGIGVYNERGGFIGADIILAAPTPGTASSAPPANAEMRHADVLRAYVQASMDEVQISKSRTFLQTYIITQIDILQILLARMGGPEMRATLENLINEAARQKQIPAAMRNGYLEFTSRTMDFSVYRTLLRVAVDYAVDAVGKRIVGSEMQEVDRQIEPGLLQVISQLDVRSIFSD